MKKFLFIFLSLTTAIVAYPQTKCSLCNGQGKFLCNGCGGKGVIYQQIYNPYYGVYQTVPYRCAGCGGYGAIMCQNCGGRGYTMSSPNFQSNKTFVRTSYGCKICKNGKGCSGYWGYYHSNGTYEGRCTNSDGWGHPCGHGPEAHGLKSW